MIFLFLNFSSYLFYKIFSMGHLLESFYHRLWSRAVSQNTMPQSHPFTSLITTNMTAFLLCHISYLYIPFSLGCGFGCVWYNSRIPFWSPCWFLPPTQHQNLGDIMACSGMNRKCYSIQLTWMRWLFQSISEYVIQVVCIGSSFLSLCLVELNFPLPLLRWFSLYDADAKDRN